MPIKVNGVQPQESLLHRAIGVLGEVGSTAQAYNTVKGWAGDGGVSAAGADDADFTTTAAPAAAATAGGAADAGAADAAWAWRGGIVPGRANVAGDSKSNDTKNYHVSPGEEIIPRTTVQEGPAAVQQFAMDAMKRRMGK